MESSQRVQLSSGNWIVAQDRLFRYTSATDCCWELAFPKGIGEVASIRANEKGNKGHFLATDETSKLWLATWEGSSVAWRTPDAQSVPEFRAVSSEELKSDVCTHMLLHSKIDKSHKIRSFKHSLYLEVQGRPWVVGVDKHGQLLGYDLSFPPNKKPQWELLSGGVSSIKALWGAVHHQTLVLFIGDNLDRTSVAIWDTKEGGMPVWQPSHWQFAPASVHFAGSHALLISQDRQRAEVLQFSDKGVAPVWGREGVNLACIHSFQEGEKSTFILADAQRQGIIGAYDLTFTWADASLAVGATPFSVRGFFDLSRAVGAVDPSGSTLFCIYPDVEHKIWSLFTCDAKTGANLNLFEVGQESGFCECAKIKGFLLEGQPAAVIHVGNNLHIATTSGVSLLQRNAIHISPQQAEHGVFQVEDEQYRTQLIRIRGKVGQLTLETFGDVTRSLAQAHVIKHAESGVWVVPSGHYGELKYCDIKPRQPDTPAPAETVLGAQDRARPTILLVGWSATVLCYWILYRAIRATDFPRLSWARAFGLSALTCGSAVPAGVATLYPRLGALQSTDLGTMESRLEGRQW